MDELKARLAALEAENKALRKGEAAATNGNETPSDKKNDKAKKTAEKKKEKEPAKPKQKAKKGAKSTAAGAEKTEEEAVPMVDVSAWDDFQLDSQIMGALSKMGFSAPTHVQAECIPAAIRDRRDVIGAAQTVRKKENEMFASNDMIFNLCVSTYAYQIISKISSSKCYY